eukprot:3174762-Rhodomonas_salina.1
MEGGRWVQERDGDTNAERGYVWGKKGESGIEEERETERQERGFERQTQTCRGGGWTRDILISEVHDSDHIAGCPPKTCPVPLFSALNSRKRRCRMQTRIKQTHVSHSTCIGSRRHKQAQAQDSGHARVLRLAATRHHPQPSPRL